MAYKIVWSPEALEDVEAIATYISRDSTSYAAAVVEKIFDAIQSLDDSPFSGKIVPEFSRETIREQSAYNYRIIYEIDGYTVKIVAVIHGKR